jgi:hypothetical protein
MNYREFRFLVWNRKELFFSLHSDSEMGRLIQHREVSEWLKEHAWKVCIPQKGIEGSNPFLSAEKPTLEIRLAFLF